MAARNCIFVGVIEGKFSLRAAVSVVQFFRQVMAARTVQTAIASSPGCCVTKSEATMPELEYFFCATNILMWFLPTCDTCNTCDM